MTAFLIAAVIMFVIAFALILPPLFRKNISTENESIENDANLSIGRERLRDLKNDLRAGRVDQQQFDQARSELEQNLAQVISEEKNSSVIKTNSPILALFLAIILPLLAAGIYMKTGLPEALDPEFEQKLLAQQEPDVATMISSIKEHLKKSPDDGEAWMVLAKSYLSMNRFAEAEDAYQHAYKIIGDDVSLLADYADAIGRGNNSDLTGKAKPLIERALEVDPDHSKLGWLAGMLAFQEQEYAKVPGFLQPLLAQTEPGSEIHEGLKRLINEAQSQSGELPAIEKEEKEDHQTTPLSLRVSLSENLKDKVDPEDVVFIYAKAVQGSPMPLAAAKLKVKDLPASLTLGDDTAMRPDMKISDHKMVTINARISKSGDPIAASGDLQAEAIDVKTQSGEIIELIIDQEVP